MSARHANRFCILFSTSKRARFNSNKQKWNALKLNRIITFNILYNHRHSGYGTLSNVNMKKISVSTLPAPPPPVRRIAIVGTDATQRRASHINIFILQLKSSIVLFAYSICCWFFNSFDDACAAGKVLENEAECDERNQNTANWKHRCWR